MKKRRTTIIDVAKRAEVSPKTVSRVLNNEQYVRDSIREAVRNAVRELDYHPNINAQSLIAQRSYLIGLTYERPSPSYVVELQKGALERLENERYRLIVLPFEMVSSRIEELSRFLLSAGLDGVILAPPSCEKAAVLDALERHEVAYARITPHQLQDRGIVASMDETAAGEAIANHLLELSHRRIGIILGDPNHAATTARMDGYRKAFAAYGASVDQDLVTQGDFTFPTGLAAGYKLLDRARPPSAILAQNDDMAVAAMMAARELGMDVPRDLSIAGYDDSEVSRLSWPPITTIHQPVREMAWDATDRLLRKLDSKSEDVGTGELEGHKLHPYRLIVRGSTASPRS